MIDLCIPFTEGLVFSKSSASMIPATSSRRIQEAHKSIARINRFLNRYALWIADAASVYCDFALGNPQTTPMPEFVSAIRDAVEPQNPNWYAYKMSERRSREIVRDELEDWMKRHYSHEDILLTNGATGALTVTMNALIAPDDEVLYCTPVWFFYEGMILNSGGFPVPVRTTDGFDLDLDAIESAITERSRMIIINSPNNPTGKVYSRETLSMLSEILERKSVQFGRTIYLISDEAYRRILYDEQTFASPTEFYANSIMIYTYGKTLLTPGQRIGYLALSPEMDHLDETRELMLSSQILSGWAMCSALMQHSLERLAPLALDIRELQRRRDLLVKGLNGCGYDVCAPEGTFYITPKTPTVNDADFADALAREGVFCLPGHIVEMPGRLRLSVTATEDMIERAMPVFADVRHRFVS